MILFSNFWYEIVLFFRYLKRALIDGHTDLLSCLHAAVMCSVGLKQVCSMKLKNGFVSHPTLSCQVYCVFVISYWKGHFVCGYWDKLGWIPGYLVQSQHVGKLY